MVLGMLVCMSLLMSSCVVTVISALLISSDTVNVRAGGCFLLKCVAIVLFMLRNVSTE